ncbi:MAG: exonuclease domain-containing protein [Clostridia bacterium]|jgi:DNA polymerase III epsilon subunit family exonuclease|nr:exonuclease domain-containing protein [Clostridia bacterium]
MLNSKFIEYIYSKLPEQDRFFRLAEVIINENGFLKIIILVPADKYDNYMSDNLKNLIVKHTKDLLKEDIFEIIYRKTVSDDSYIKTELIKYFYKHNPIIMSQICDDDVDIITQNDLIKLRLNTSKELKDYISNNSIIDSVVRHLEKYIYEEIEFIVEESKSIDYSARKRINFIGNNNNKIRLINISLKTPLYETIAKQPIYISDLEKIRDEVVVCGKLSDFRKGISRKNSKPWASFVLNDTTGRVKCLFFAKNKKQYNVVDQLNNDMTVVVSGSYNPPRENDRAEWLIFIDKIGVCDIDYSSITLDVPYKEVPSDYLTVEPTPYEQEIQSSFFVSEGPLDDRLRGNIVVFDLETTGINITEDKIIEIGAVKLVDGVIKEKFQTFVNPGKNIHIPEEASKVNNIFDEDIEDAPSFSEVIPDFFKFCYGSTLVAHNSTFDVGMITYYARQYSYNFDHNVIDTLKLAREVLHRTTGVSLEVLRKKFKIDTGDAHRALNDAVATAKLLKELLKIGKN